MRFLDKDGQHLAAMRVCLPKMYSKPERVEMIKAYQSILLVHSHDTRELSQAVLEIEKASFLEGH
jgi:predicted metal-binding protein